MVALSKFCYNPAVYRALGEVQVVAKSVNGDNVKGLGRLICKYGHDQALVVVLAHKHHELADSEAMVEKQEDSNDDWIVARPMPLVEIEKLAEGGKPNMLALGPDGNWHTVQFTTLEAQTMPESVLADIAFLAESARFLQAQGLAGKLMLGVRDRQQSANKGVVTAEFNDLDTRTSVVRPLAKGELLAMAANNDMVQVQTTFAFNAVTGIDGDGISGDFPECQQELCVQICILCRGCPRL